MFLLVKGILDFFIFKSPNPVKERERGGGGKDTMPRFRGKVGQEDFR